MGCVVEGGVLSAVRVVCGAVWCVVVCGVCVWAVLVCSVSCVVWCGVVWCGVVWCVVWCGLWVTLKNSRVWIPSACVSIQDVSVPATSPHVFEHADVLPVHTETF